MVYEFNRAGKGSRIQGFPDGGIFVSLRQVKSKKYSKKGTQILLAGDLALIEKGESGTLKKNIAEIERMLKALIKSLKKQTLESLTPGILGPSSPTKLEKNFINQYSSLRIKGIFSSFKI
jgi:hypothetical protein